MAFSTKMQCICLSEQYHISVRLAWTTAHSRLGSEVERSPSPMHNCNSRHIWRATAKSVQARRTAPHSVFGKTTAYRPHKGQLQQDRVEKSTRFAASTSWAYHLIAFTNQRLMQIEDRLFHYKSTYILQLAPPPVRGLAKIGKPLREFSELKRKIFTLWKSVKESVENPSNKLR